MKSLFKYCLFLLFTTTTYAQVSLTFPNYKAVFQRDNNNSGFIPVSGNFSGDVDRIEARLIPVKSGQGTFTDWQLVQQNPQSGSFYGKVSGLAGWYLLDIRATYKGVEKATTYLERVGIGEVFIISGQSNAQGRRLFGSKSSTDERVNKVDYLNATDDFDNFDIRPFTGITGEGIMAPGGESGWCWGELGDLLANKLNVPIVFFNAGWGGIEYYKWAATIKGETVSSIYGNLPAGQPYANLKYAGQFYASIYGVRAMLWTQGEGRDIDLPADYTSDLYTSSIQSLFNKFRSDVGKNVGIVVSRTSLSVTPVSNPKTILGQNNLINKVGNNIFAGPLTDTVQVNRPDGTHFQNIPGDAGISKLAVSWNNALTIDFFSRCTPFPPSPIVPISTVICRDGANPVLQISSDYSYQRWSNGSTAKEISVSDGYYSAILRDRIGNVVLTPSIDTKIVKSVTAPTISVDGALAFCSGKSVQLKAVGDYAKFRWNTDDTSKVITIKRGGEYSVQGVNQYGCLSSESVGVGITVYGNPQKPVITPSGALNFCQGGQVTLNGPSNAGIYNWSSGTTSRNVVANQSGTYSLKISDINGCESPLSDPVVVSVKANPSPPTISNIGTYTIEAVVPLDAQSSDVFSWFKDNQELSQKSAIVKSQTDGKFTALLSRNYVVGNNQRLTCKSAISSALDFKAPSFIASDFSIYPNPSTNGLIFVETKDDLQDVGLYVYNVIGNLVYSAPISLLTTRHLVDLSSLAKGVYIVKIKTTNFQGQRRILIE